MKLASVVLDIPTQALDAPYTYRVPDQALDDEYQVAVGSAVLVPFGRRQAVGFVVAIDDYDKAALPDGLDARSLKYIMRALSPSFFDEEAAACAFYLSEHYIAPLSACVRLFTPPGGVARIAHTEEGAWQLERPAVGEVDDRFVRLTPQAAQFAPRKNAVRQKAVIEALQAGELRVAELSIEFGAVSAVLKALEDQGVIEIVRKRRMRGVTDGAADSRTPWKTDAQKPQLTEGQRDALAVIDKACARAAGDVVLVDGVTGSGKTEVYLQAIEKTLAAGKTACVLVPEISLTPQTVARFRGRFGDLVAVIHSRMSQGERYDQWDFIRSGAARVVVGARSALFSPLSNVGLYVIDEEHESSYKQDSAPRYHARDVAIWMARRAGATVVLGSATPSIESLYCAAKDPQWHKVSLPERANGKPLPDVHVIDMAREFGSGSRSMFSRELATALREELLAGRKAVLLLNQRGFAKFVLCRDCGFVPTCPSCSTSLTYHERGNLLVCHHCGFRMPTPATCPNCSSPYLKKFGAGTQRVEAELRALLDGLVEGGCDIPIIRMDADTTSGKGAHQRLLETFAQADRAVLLGTQMIAKGLDFEDVTLVGVINADTQLHLPDYRSAERTFDLIEQVAGRAGRGNYKGRVLVQTYEANAAPIVAAAHYDRAYFLRDELPKRKALGYPPYARMANVLIWGKDERAVEASARKLGEEVRLHVRDFAGESWRVFEPTPCALSKLRGTYRWHILIKAPQNADMAAVLLPLFRKRKITPHVNVAVDIDPQNLL